MELSVIVPAYNRADLIALTLRSLVNQTRPADEIIVVDDGSTDCTAEVADSFGHPVRVIRQANAGPAAARNRGFQESSGEYIHFFDSDDVASPNKHEVQLGALERLGADIAFGPWVKGAIFDDEFRAEGLVLQQKGLPNGDLIRALLSNWSVVPQACLFRRSIVEKCGGFPEDLFGVEDQLMFLRCLLAGARVVHTPETLTLYRTNNSENKITGSSEGEVTRRVEWARFLLMAREECLGFGLNPMDWPGFRQRLWQAREDLTELGDAKKYNFLIEKLSDNLCEYSQPAFRISRWLQQKQGGLRMRLRGGRESASFRCGRLNAAEARLIKEVFNRV